MAANRRSFVPRRAPITPAYRQRQDGAEEPRDNLLERGIVANGDTRKAQRELNELEPLHRAASGAERALLDRRIRRALARLNKALREFVAIEQAMDVETRARLQDVIDNLPGET